MVALPVVPGFGWLVPTVLALWILVAMVVAVRQALDYAHTTRALLVCGVAFVLVVDADAALDGDRNGDRPGHGADEIAHQMGLGHQAGAEAAFLDTIRGASDIEVDLAIAEVLADPCCLGEKPRLAAANLKGDRLLLGPEGEKALAVAMVHRLGRQHLRIEERMGGQQPMEEPAMAVRPVHHGRDGKHFAARHGRWRVVGHIMGLAGSYLLLNWNWSEDRKSTRLNSSHTDISRMPSSA